VNVDPRESLSGRMAAEDFTAMVHVLPSAEAKAGDRRPELAERRQNLWRYGLMLMLGVLVVESAVGRSR
jgi:hypothetical protein